MTNETDDRARESLATALAQRDIIEFLLAAYLDSKPPEAREVLIRYLQSDMTPKQAAPLSDQAAELWADLSVRRLEARAAIVRRAQELHARMERMAARDPAAR
ncbi:MAG: hypothetical protein AB1698_03340 [Pseudomonadota bacterium]